MRNSSLAATLSTSPATRRPFHPSASHHAAPRRNAADSWRAGLTRTAVSLSAMAAAALAAALTFPGAARAETAATTAPSAEAFALAARPATPAGPRFDAGAAPYESSGNALARLASAAAAPHRVFVPHVRVESGTENGVMAAWQVRDYDLRFEYGTVLTRTAAVPFQRNDAQVERSRVTTRLVTRF